MTDTRATWRDRAAVGLVGLLALLALYAILSQGHRAPEPVKPGGSSRAAPDIGSPPAAPAPASSLAALGSEPGRTEGTAPAPKPSADPAWLELRGRVVDAGGEPVPGAEVTISVTDPANREITDARGEFQARVPHDTYQLKVIARAAGHAPSRWHALAPRKDQQLTCELRLGQACTLRGRVVDPAGQPVAARVEIRTFIPILGGGPRPFHTDSLTCTPSGAFTFTDLNAGAYELVLWHKNYLQRPAFSVEAAETTAPLTITLEPAAFLEGIVPRPLPETFRDVVVRATVTGFAESVEGHANDDGTYSLKLPPGQGVLQVERFNTHLNRDSSTEFAWASFDARAGRVTRLNLTFKPLTEVTVHVPPDCDPTLQPEPRDGLLGSILFGQLERPAAVGNVFTFRVPPGNYRLQLRAPVAIQIVHQRSLTVGTAKLSVELVPDPGELAGVVVNAAGLPVADAQVLAAWPERVSRSCKTDSAGRFRIAGPLDSLRLLVAHEPSMRVAALTLNSPHANLTIRLEPGATLEGVLVDSRGQGVPGVELVAANSHWQSIQHAAKTDSEGRFQFGGLADGTYALHSGPGTIERRALAEVSFKVAAGATPPLRVTLQTSD